MVDAQVYAINAILVRKVGKFVDKRIALVLGREAREVHAATPAAWTKSAVNAKHTEGRLF